jgi:hypothetical protein
MADSTLVAITAALAQNYRDPIIRTLNARSTILKTLKVVKGEGKNCAWVWEGSGAIGENYSEGADVSNTGSDSLNPAVLSWAMYRSNFKITDLSLSTSRSSASPVGYQMQIGRHFENAARKLATTLNDEFYNGLGTGTLIAGLDVALDDGNTYAAVNRATGGNEPFRATVIDPGAPTAPTLALIRKDLSDIYDACGEVPDIAYCNSAAWNKLASLFTEVRRYNQDSVTTAKGKVTLDASVGAIELDGCTFVKDKDATAGSIYYVNSNYVEVEYLPFVDEDVLKEVMRTDMNLSDGYGPMPLGMTCIQLARAGAARKWTSMVQLQLAVRKPNACGIRLNLLTT